MAKLHFIEFYWNLPYCRQKYFYSISESVSVTDSLFLGQNFFIFWFSEAPTLIFGNPE